MATLYENVHIGHDNTIDLQLTEDGKALEDHTLITRVVLKFEGGPTQADIDSDVNPEYFDFTNTDKVILILGLAGIPVGKYRMTLIVYDVVNVNGIDWRPKVTLIAD